VKSFRRLRPDSPPAPAKASQLTRAQAEALVDPVRCQERRDRHTYGAHPTPAEVARGDAVPTVERYAFSVHRRDGARMVDRLVGAARARRNQRKGEPELEAARRVAKAQGREALIADAMKAPEALLTPGAAATPPRKDGTTPEQWASYWEAVALFDQRYAEWEARGKHGPPPPRPVRPHIPGAR
jgi:hypothetical protein